MDDDNHKFTRNVTLNITMTEMLEKIEHKLIDSAIRVVKDGEGCLYVIQLSGLDYESLIKNDFEKFSIFEEVHQKRLDILAKTDGACIINNEGELVGYGAKINNTQAFEGYGTRHAAAFSASLIGNIAILGSQENKKIRIFKEGKLVMQIDTLEKGIEQETGKAVNLLESVGIGALSTLGAGLLFPAVAVAILPGILIFGSTHFIIKSIFKK